MSTMKSELEEAKAENAGMKTSNNEDPTKQSTGAFHVKDIKIRIDTDKGMLWGGNVSFDASSATEIMEKMTDLYLAGILDTRKKEPSTDWKKGGMKS